MARRSRRTRRARSPRRSLGPPAPRADDFDDIWLSRIRERFDARYIDLTKIEDRRRWHPDNLGPPIRTLRGMRGPRILIVPEGHKLARLQTYGGRHSLRSIVHEWHTKQRKRKEVWQQSDWPYGSLNVKARHAFPERRLGFALPWQVIICVRRKRRREVMHALKIAGARGIGKGKPRHTDEYTQVRC